ncbi:transposase [Patescibacteria group bacterium]|nr:transposase [Patescibacteria group bacterium]MBU1921615.1 transposase [Patescibacteria group bacterium]
MKDGRYWCGRCRQKYSLKQLAGLKGSRLPLAKIALLTRCFLKNYPLAVAQDTTGLSYPTVRRYYDIFRLKANKYTLEHAQFLKGRIVIDACYIGKKRNNNQAVVLGAVEEDYTNLAFRIIPQEEQGYVEKFLYDTACPWSHIIHDGHKAYEDLSWTGVTHEAEIHELGQFEKSCPIERIWALLRTRIRRTYHHIWKEKLPDYLAEFRYKFLYRSTALNELSFLEFLTLPAPRA